MAAPSRWLRLGKGTDMAVYKRTWKRPDGSTAFCWYFHRTINGVRYRDRIPTARTKAQAEEGERRILAEIHDGTYGKPRENRTFDNYVDQVYLPWAKNNKRSWRTDLFLLKPIRPLIGRKKLNQVSQFDIEKCKLHLQKNKGAHKRERSKSTINKTIKLLRRIFRMAKVKENPALEVELLKGETKRKRRLRPDEKEVLLPAIFQEKKRAHLLAIVIADLNLGLRRSELLSLTPDDIDFERGLVRVHSTKTDAREEDIREVPMNRTACSLMTELVAKARENGWQYIFTNPRTGTRYKSVKRAFRSACKDAGIANLRFHDLRHTFASNAGDDPNVTLPALMETLGHRDPRTTMQYTHANRQGMLRVVEAAEKWNHKKSGHKLVTKEERQAS
jgi:integrase